MSTQDGVEPIEEETQETEVDRAEIEVAHEVQGVDSDREDEQGQVRDKKKRAKNPPAPIVREMGKSLLPFARVQKIIKADKEIPIIAKDATFLISLATEEFIKRLSEEGKRIAEREKRSTIQYKDIATAVRKADEFIFLEEIIPWVVPDAPARRKTQAEGGVKGERTILDQFMTKKRTEEDEIVEGGDIVMNTDGTMGLAGDSIMESTGNE